MKIASVDKGNFGIVTFTTEEDGIYANFEKFGVSSKCFRVVENGVKFLDITINGKKFNGVSLDKETLEKVSCAIKTFHLVIAHVCWECGRTFYHRPASDGTCGEC